MSIEDEEIQKPVDHIRENTKTSAEAVQFLEAIFERVRNLRAEELAIESNLNSLGFRAQTDVSVYKNAGIADMLKTAESSHFTRNGTTVTFLKKGVWYFRQPDAVAVSLTEIAEFPSFLNPALAQCPAAAPGEITPSRKSQRKKAFFATPAQFQCPPAK